MMALKNESIGDLIEHSKEQEISIERSVKNFKLRRFGQIKDNVTYNVEDDVNIMLR